MNNIDRRDFGKIVTKGICVGCLSSILNSCEFIEEKLVAIEQKQKKEYKFPISKYPQLSELNKAIAVSILEITGGRNIIILRKSFTGEDAFIVMSAICPHGGYTVSVPSNSSNNYYCLEHNSEYDYSSGEMRRHPDTEPDYTGHLRKFVSKYDELAGVLTICY